MRVARRSLKFELTRISFGNLTFETTRSLINNWCVILWLYCVKSSIKSLYEQRDMNLASSLALLYRIYQFNARNSINTSRWSTDQHIHMMQVCKWFYHHPYDQTWYLMMSHMTCSRSRGWRRIHLVMTKLGQGMRILSYEFNEEI